jgi:hypothetical protein
MPGNRGFWFLLMALQPIIMLEAVVPVMLMMVGFTVVVVAEITALIPQEIAFGVEAAALDALLALLAHLHLEVLEARQVFLELHRVAVVAA